MDMGAGTARAYAQDAKASATLAGMDTSANFRPLRQGEAIQGQGSEGIAVGAAIQSVELSR